jgi:hypothetical protein
VTWDHLSAFLWLRWRLVVNTAKRAGAVSAAITAIVAVFALMSSLALFTGGLFFGALGMPHLPPVGRLGVWTGLVLFFLFFWTIGLLTALQRSESLALDKVLHLPVSPAGGFLVNYLSSFLSVTLILFVPGMVGLALGEVYSAGPVMLLGFPLLAAFVFALTALTYQFQGWLASLVSNPRRRRTIIVFLTMGIVLLAQVPNLVMTTWMPFNKLKVPPAPVPADRLTELNEKLKTNEITVQQYTQRLNDLQSTAHKQAEDEEQDTLEKVERVARLACTVLPPGWVSVGMADLADGGVTSALLGTFGLGLIGVLSLFRAYRTTLRMYTEGLGGGGGGTAPAADAARPAGARPGFLEWQLPGIPEGAAAVALAGFRCLARAPEVKMFLIAPVVLFIVFGNMFNSTGQAGKPYAPLMVMSVVGLILLTMMQFTVNTFGFDRDGFRSFVLSPVPRRDILLGKNLASGPLALGLGLIAILGGGLVLHLRWDQFLTAGFQLLTMYLLYSLIGNFCSIFAPFVIPAGSLKGARPPMSVVMVQLACMVVVPFAVGIPGVGPTLVEMILSELDVLRGVPVALVLSVLVFVATLWIYNRLLTWEGGLLEGREQRILDVVSTKAE